MYRLKQFSVQKDNVFKLLLYHSVAFLCILEDPRFPMNDVILFPSLNSPSSNYVFYVLIIRYIGTRMSTSGKCIHLLQTRQTLLRLHEGIKLKSVSLL